MQRSLGRPSSGNKESSGIATTPPSSPLPLGALLHPNLAIEVPCGASLEFGKQDPLVVFLQAVSPSGLAVVPLSPLPLPRVVWLLFGRSLAVPRRRLDVLRLRARLLSSLGLLSCVRSPPPPSRSALLPASAWAPLGRRLVLLLFVSSPPHVVVSLCPVASPCSPAPSRLGMLMVALALPGSMAGQEREHPSWPPQSCRTASARQGQTTRDLHHVGQFS